MGERLFSVAEANELLAEVRPLIEELVRATAEVNAPERRLELSRLTEANVSTAAIAPLLKPAEVVTRLVIRIGALGIDVKDPVSGLIDFPAERRGRPIYLCWLLGEPHVGHWHDRDAGFAGREAL